MKKLLAMFVGLSLLGAVALSGGCRGEAAVDTDGRASTQSPLPR